MGLDSRPDRLGGASHGIPGAAGQPPLPKMLRKSKGAAGRSSLRTSRRATRALSCQLLNGLLADSMVLYEHYRKDNLLVCDPSDRGLRALLDQHAGEQRELIERTVERVRLLGGFATVPRQVVELTVISRPPNDREEVPEMLSRLIEAHERIIARIRDAITATTASGDSGTNELLKDMLRRHELHAWSIAEQLVDTTALSA